jgi:hypothetical protein
MKTQPWMSLLCLLPALCAAQVVHKCEEDGKITYTDRTCPATAKAGELPGLIVAAPPSASVRSLARAHDERLARGQAERDRDDAAWLKEHARARDREERVRKAIVEHRVIKGMTAEEVNQSLGTPDQVASSESFGSDKETWTYQLDGKTRTINFKDRQVTTTSAKQAGRGGRGRSSRSRGR